MTRLVLAALMLIAATGCSRGGDRIECPAPETGSGEGAVRETQAQIDAAGVQLGRGDENEIAEVAGGVRSRHAGASKAAIVNYLVTAYCPQINGRADLDRAAKRQALDAFSARAGRIVH